MSASAPPEFALWTLFRQLQRRQFPLGIADFHGLRAALRAGFGWSSRADLRVLCCALWAKSPAEQAVVRTLFDQLPLEDWTLRVEPAEPAGSAAAGEGLAFDAEPLLDEESDAGQPGADEPGAVAPLAPVLPPLPWPYDANAPVAHVFLAQFPVNYRVVAQTWRRLRWLVREGPKTELDVQATIERRTRNAVATPPVLTSPRRNRARLLLLVDRQGSMAPFHSFVAEVCDTIRQTSRLENVAVAYFHDTPLEGADSSLLDSLIDPASSSLDSVLPQVSPLNEGVLFDDPDLLLPLAARQVLGDHAPDAAIVVISDAGAARGHTDLLRLLDTVAFLKALKLCGGRIVWLNPMPGKTWAKTTAAQIARHVPMFPMDAEGMHHAVNVLRGHPFVVERAV